MKIAVLGYGVEGKAAVTYWSALGADITVCDQNTSIEVPDGVNTVLGDDYLENLKVYDLIVRSAGLAPQLIQEANPAIDLTAKLTSVTREFMAKSPARIIGVTGTKGKGTTTMLIAGILKASGQTVHVGGNIGIPAVALLEKIQSTDWVVLELSSYQLTDATQSPHIGVHLMFAPEHQDWHIDQANYQYSKANIFRYQSGDDLAVYDVFSEAATQAAELSPGKKLTYEVPPIDQEPAHRDGAYVEGELIKFNETVITEVSKVTLLGRHNLENICAAIAATWDATSGDVEAMARTIAEFKGLPHRLQAVAEVSGVTFIDDSISGIPDSARAALAAFSAPKVMILGGKDRGQDFADLARDVKSANVKAVVVTGQTAGKIKTALNVEGYDRISEATSMPEIVAVATKLTEPGDLVLLSPGCPSYDAYKNFEDRGDQFKAAAQALEVK